MDQPFATLFWIPLAACIVIGGCGASRHVEERDPLPTGEEVAETVSADAQRSYEADPKAVLYASSRQPAPAETKDETDDPQTRSAEPVGTPVATTSCTLWVPGGGRAMTARSTDSVDPDQPHVVHLPKLADLDAWINGLKPGQRVTLHMSPSTTYEEGTQVIDRLAKNDIEWVLKAAANADEPTPAPAAADQANE